MDQIDPKLNEIAKQFRTTVATSGGGFTANSIPVPDNKIEMRKVIWIDGKIGKGIIIIQNFRSGNIDNPAWDFENIAWLNEEVHTSKGKPFWKKTLLKETNLEEIKKNIDALLKESLENLKAVKRSDLGYD
jgi:hypothetical protein